MKKLGIVIVAALATVCVLAQDKPRRGGRHRGERPAAGERQMHGPMMHAAGAWVPRMLADKASLEKIGVTDGALCTKLLAELKPLKEQGDVLEKKIREISREQAQLMRGLLKDKASDPKAAMDKIDEVAKLRAEQGRLSVRALVVLRDNLSSEQLEKAREFILERGRERGRMRQGMGPGRERPVPPPDGSAPRNKPFAADNQG
ncbi:MAG: hypothetical protein IJI36_00755 [Kiritimatiellae bacterium]|nr:hypothetical protein [Kiritimatiellia bacterium]